MRWPKKNSYKEFDNEKQFLRLEHSPPPPHNFSNGPSLTTPPHAGFLGDEKRAPLKTPAWEASPLRDSNREPIKD